MLRSRSFLSSFGNFKTLCENGHLGKALEDLQNWENSGIHVSPSMYHCLLQGCSKTKNINLGRHVLSTITRTGLFPRAIFGAVVIRMFTSCGTLQEAQWVFARLPQPDLLAWTAIMSAHTKYGKNEEVVQLFAQLQLSNLEADQHIFVVVLKACTSMASLMQGMLVHGHILETGFEADTFVGNALVEMYTKCGNLEDGGKVFDALPSPSVVTWTMMIVGFTEQGHGKEALRLFWQMQTMAIIESDKAVFVCALKACSILGSLDQGQLVHARIVEEGHERILTVSNTLVDIYAKCGSLEDARKVFQSNSERSLVTWNTMIAAFSHRPGQEQEAFHFLQLMKKDGIHPSTLTWNSMISGLVQQGQAQQALHLFHKLLCEGITPDKAVFVSVLKGCSAILSVELGWVIHGHIIETFHDLEITVCNTLIDMYGRCGSLQDARMIFERTSKQSVVAWSAVIGAYLQRQHYEEAFFLFEQMRSYGVEPNYVTFLSMMKGCSNQASLMWGRAIHDHIIKFNFEMDTFVGNCLIDMYTKCGTLEDACSVFEDMPKKCVVTWTAMITGFAQNGNVAHAYTLFKHMQQDGVQPNIVTWNAMLAGAAEHGYDVDCLHLFQQMQDWGLEVDDMTLVSVLKACGSLALLNQGLLVHCLVIETSLEHDVYVYNTLIDMYMKCGSAIHAQSVFKSLPKQKVEAWNAMLGGCPEHVLGESADVRMFDQMDRESILPGECTHMSNLTAHSSTLALRQERLLSTTVTERMFASESIACTDAVCNHVEVACEVYKKHLDPVSHAPSARVSGSTHPSNSKSVMEVLPTMQAKGSKPDTVTFISLLSACCEMGLLHEGCQLFSSMSQDHGITPKLDHFNCLVSLISNAGSWNEAEDLLQTMPFPPDIIGWTSLLCRSHGNIDLGERCFEQVVSLDHRDAAGFQQLSSMYADAGMWKGVDLVEDWRQCSNSWKKPGRAYVEIDDVAHMFVVGDTSHSQMESINVKVQSLNVQLKLEGYTPQAPSTRQATEGSMFAL